VLVEARPNPPYSRGAMADFDPNITDLAKVGGGGALASALTILAGRIFGSQDKVLARLDVLQATLSELTQKLAVLMATSEHRDNDVEHLKREMTSLKLQLAEHDRQLARLETMLERLSEGS